MSSRHPRLLWSALTIAAAGVGALVVRAGGARPVALGLAILASVVAHEVGHFLVARRNRMAVTHFSVGFGRPLVTRQIGPTLYALRALPFGGSVRVAGMNNLDDPPAGIAEANTYRAAPFGPRVRVALAGPCANFLVAFTVFTVAFAGFGDARKMEATTTIRLVAPASAAALAGVRPGDRITGIGGQPVSRFADIRAALHAARPGDTLRLELDRQGRRVELAAALPQQGPVVLGVTSEVVTPRLGPIAALNAAQREVRRNAALELVGLANFVRHGASTYQRQLANKAPAVSDAEHPRFVSAIGFARVAAATGPGGWWVWLYILAMVNVFLATLNLLPIPPLDGGLVAVVGYERIRTRRGQARYAVDYRRLVPFVAVVVGLFGLVGVATMALDIIRPVHV
ncbi:MAG TPA: M50 family metallopeptidase [Acidimicrobiales bacterium]|nr:M50 family metallopeptidase [Acidimicrobiales bacterium]